MINLTLTIIQSNITLNVCRITRLRWTDNFVQAAGSPPTNKIKKVIKIGSPSSHFTSIKNIPTNLELPFL